MCVNDYAKIAHDAYQVSIDDSFGRTGSWRQLEDVEVERQVAWEAAAKAVLNKVRQNILDQMAAGEI